MIFYITVLRALAACIILNSHYEGVYPTDIIANGGLLGNILFFGVSGYCLYNIKLNFLSWYLKRIIRIYIPVWLITSILLVCGYYSFVSRVFLQYYIYPTDYHFIASIITLYIPYYFLIKNNYLEERLAWIILFLSIVHLAVYVFFYDKSYYHIDVVDEPMIRFLYFECMLTGAFFRKKDSYFRRIIASSRKVSLCFIVSFMAICYFISKILFVNNQSFSNFQFINQILIYCLFFGIFILSSSLDSDFAKLPEKLKKIISFISSITLEVYLVQFYFIAKFKNSLSFPFNWIILTCSIIISAFLLHVASDFILKKYDNLLFKIKNLNFR